VFFMRSFFQFFSPIFSPQQETRAKDDDDDDDDETDNARRREKSGVKERD
jgi:hypothetical protein